MNRFAKKRLFHAKAGAKGGKRADLGGLYMRSSWEANCARALNVMKERGEIVGWQYEPTEFAFPVKRGTRFYRPDFAVDYGDGIGVKYWEIKGLMQQKDVTALQRMARYHPTVSVLIVDKNKYAEIQSEFGDIETWEK